MFDIFTNQTLLFCLDFRKKKSYKSQDVLDQEMKRDTLNAIDTAQHAYDVHAFS